MKTYYGYTRVSTAKQGEQGVSLQEQRSAIDAYASRAGVSISKWFEERETAAKRGRPIFDRMMKLLRDGKADGVIIHKIDRSARNLRDWSDLGEMMDGGIEVHFANEALDLNSRGGRLSADIQAVVAADYIRNLRDETIKGMRGRYKQGLFPLPAPIGYRDQGSGLPKTIDPMQGPLVKKMFELYASAQYGHLQLEQRMYELGLRTKRRQRVKKSTLAWMLSNPFYYGLIRLKATNQLFEGKHQPIISHTLFKAAREVSAQRLNKRAVKHDFSFRRCVRCGICGYNLSGERVKGHVYYRCHTQSCPSNTIREDRLLEPVIAALSTLQMREDERGFLAETLKEMTADGRQQRSDLLEALQAGLGNIDERLSRLADAYLDGILDRDVLQDKQKALLMERKEIEGRLRDIQQRCDGIIERLTAFIDFAADVRSVFELASPSVRQQLLRRVVLRVTVQNKTVTVLLNRSYQLFSARPTFRSLPQDGVGPSEPDIPNRGPDGSGPVNIGGSSNESPNSPINDLYGCPSQSGLRRGVKYFLLGIGQELLNANDSQDGTQAAYPCYEEAKLANYLISSPNLRMASRGEHPTAHH